MTALPVIGVDVGGTKMAAGIVGADGLLVDYVLHPTPTESQLKFLAGLEAAVEGLAARGPVAAIGFGVPSRVDQVAHRVVGSVHVPLAGVDLAGHMSERFGVPASVDNDGNSAAVAEWKLGAGRGTNHMVMLTLGTGIGAGLILGGRPYRGALGGGAELGHMVIDVDGPPCGGSCTGHGHFETLASGSAASARARELGFPDAHALVAAARNGDARAVEALAGIGRVLGAGLVTIVNVFEPEVIVIGGGFSDAGELVLGPAREVVAAEALQPGRDFVRIVRAELGPEAGMIGAALIALEALGDAA
jgi:glucokinase